MTYKPNPQGKSNRTGVKNGPDAKKTGPVVRAMDWERIAELAKIQCTITEIATIEGISHNWLAELCERDTGMKLGEFVEQNRTVGHESLRRAQWRTAIEKDNVAMQIFLGKNWLGQSDKIEHAAGESRILTLNYGDPNEDRDTDVSEIGESGDDSEENDETEGIDSSDNDVV